MGYIFSPRTPSPLSFSQAGSEALVFAKCRVCAADLGSFALMEAVVGTLGLCVLLAPSSTFTSPCRAEAMGCVGVTRCMLAFPFMRHALDGSPPPPHTTIVSTQTVRCSMPSRPSTQTSFGKAHVPGTIKLPRRRSMCKRHVHSPACPGMRCTLRWVRWLGRSRS